MSCVRNEFTSCKALALHWVKNPLTAQTVALHVNLYCIGWQPSRAVLEALVKGWVGHAGCGMA